MIITLNRGANNECGAKCTWTARTAISEASVGGHFCSAVALLSR